MSLEEFVERARIIHDDEYDYSEVVYKNNKTKVCIICHKHNKPFKFWQNPNSHLRGDGCPKCYGNLKLTLEEFIERANKIHGNKYDYSKSKYINSQTLIEIICLEHGSFWQTPHAHLSNQGCPICGESQGEKKIRIFLTKNDIKFEQEKQFNGCKNVRPLLFDFYLPQCNLCIEYDGKQHFIPHDFNSKESDEKKLENLKLVQLRDQIKNDYCEQKGINLLRIKYDENVEEKLTEYFKECDVEI